MRSPLAEGPGQPAPKGMRPVLFVWRGRAARSYPALLSVGVMAGLAAGDVAAKATGLDGARVYAADLILLPIALIGARLASVAANWSRYRDDRARIWRRGEGGQAMYGGLIMVPLSVPLLAAFRLPFWAFWDAGAFTLLTGMIFARGGCLLTGCCSGRPTASRFGLVLSNHLGVRTRRIPTQLLEAALALLSLGAAALVVTSGAAPGSAFRGSLAVYTIGRLAVQPLREKESRVAGVPALRAASAALFIFALVLSLPRLT